MGDNSNGGSGIDGGSDDCSCGDGKTAAVVAMATAMAAARQQRHWRQQQWQWGKIQQSTEKGTTKTAMATEMATVIDSLLPRQPEWPGIPPPPGAEGWGGRDMVVKMRMWREEIYWCQIQRKEE